MSFIDPELLNDFVAEVDSLNKEMRAVVQKLSQNKDQPELYKHFSQLVDRIYGTAATFGFAELASYCGMLKKACLECGNPLNKRAQLRVFALMENCTKHLADLSKGISDPEIVQSMKHTLHIEAQKATKLHEEIFQFSKKAA